MSTAPLRDALDRPGPSISFEFFPPKDDAGERTLWRSIRDLEPLRPAFVSVTYGAGGSTRDRTVRITGRIAPETTLRPVGHLTCVGQTCDELRTIIGQYAAAGVSDVLALRGDPPGGAGTRWQQHPGGLANATELVRLVRRLGSFCFGVAAFTRGHPEAPSLEADARVLAAKAAAGADFAVTQFFFRAEEYFALVERAAAHGCDVPVLPGIMPVTSLGQVTTMARLSGFEVPPEVMARLQPLADNPAALRMEGALIATELCGELLAGGAPRLHFYTLNRSTATRQVFADLGVGVPA